MSSSSTILLGHTNSVWCSSFSHDGSYIATSSSDETTRIWSLGPDLVRGQEVACLGGHEGVVRSCDFSPDSSLLATCSWDKSIHIHTSSNFRLRTKLVGHKYGVSHVRFSPNGSVLASCSWDDTVGLWDVQTGMLLHYLRGHTSPVASCVFLHEGSALASCSWDGAVKIWDLSQLQQAVVTLSGHMEPVFDVSSCPSDVNLLASCGRKGVLVLWDLRNQVPWQMLRNGWMELNAVSFSPSGSHFVTGNNMGELHLWNMENVKVSLSTTQPSTLAAHANCVSGLRYSADGCYLASCSSDNTCRVWDTKYCFDPSVAALTESLENQLSLTNN